MAMDVLFGTYTLYQGQEIHGKGPILCMQAGNQMLDTSYEELLGLLELPTLEER